VGEWVRREQFRAVAVTYFVSADELFFGGPDFGSYKTTDGFTNTGTEHFNRTNSYALHPAVGPALAGAHINTDDAALSSTYKSSFT